MEGTTKHAIVKHAVTFVVVIAALAAYHTLIAPHMHKAEPAKKA